MAVTKKMLDNSSRREQQQRKNYNSVGEFMGSIGDVSQSPIKTEYDTWAWYYNELSNIRTECSRLGLLVRADNSESYKYIKPYYSHIYSLLQMVLTIMPYDLADKINERWEEIGRKIEEFFEDKALLGNDYKIPEELHKDLRLLHNVALKIAQEMGMGVRTQMSQDTMGSLRKTFLGE